jgi:hypothetical protein
MPHTPDSNLRVATLVIEDLADENARLTDQLATLQATHDLYVQMLSIALEMLWRANVLSEPHGEIVPKD